MNTPESTKSPGLRISSAWLVWAWLLLGAIALAAVPALVPDDWRSNRGLRIAIGAMGIGLVLSVAWVWRARHRFQPIVWPPVVWTFVLAFPMLSFLNWAMSRSWVAAAASGLFASCGILALTAVVMTHAAKRAPPR